LNTIYHNKAIAGSQVSVTLLRIDRQSSFAVTWWSSMSQYRD